MPRGADGSTSQPVRRSPSSVRQLSPSNASPTSAGVTRGRRFFDPLLDWVDQCVREAFLRPEHRALLQVAADPAGLLDALAQYRPPAETQKWIAEGDR